MRMMFILLKVSSGIFHGKRLSTDFAIFSSSRCVYLCRSEEIITGQLQIQYPALENNCLHLCYWKYFENSKEKNACKSFNYFSYLGHTSCFKFPLAMFKCKEECGTAAVEEKNQSGRGNQNKPFVVQKLKYSKVLLTVHNSSAVQFRSDIFFIH